MSLPIRQRGLSNNEKRNTQASECVNVRCPNRRSSVNETNGRNLPILLAPVSMSGSTDDTAINRALGTVRATPVVVSMSRYRSSANAICVGAVIAFSAQSSGGGHEETGRCRCTTPNPRPNAYCLVPLFLHPIINLFNLVDCLVALKEFVLFCEKIGHQCERGRTKLGAFQPWCVSYDIIDEIQHKRCSGFV